MYGYAIYELTPAPWGDDYRFIAVRDTKKSAEAIMSVLYSTSHNFNVYKIIEYNIERNGCD